MSDQPIKKAAAQEEAHYLYDINVIGRVEGVIPPKQARSSAVLQKILRAMAALIEEKEFGEITIPEVASLAGCGMAAIYSRFKDKASILAALQETLRSNLLNVEEMFPAEKWAVGTVDENIRAVVARLVSYYSSNRNLLTAVLLMKDEGCYKRAAMNISYISKILSQRLQEHIPNGRDTVDETAVDVAVRSIFALLQQRLIFHPVVIGHKPPQDEEELCEQLTGLLRACIYQKKNSPD